MKPLSAALVAALAVGPALAVAAPHPFNAQDLVMMDRVGDPVASPDGRHVAFSVRSTDYAANKGVNSLWVLDLGARDAGPRKLVDADASDPRWSADGKNIYFLSSKSGSSQIWRVPAAGGTPVQVSRYPLDVDNFTLSPDGTHVALSMAVYTDCADLACTKQRLDAREKDKATGRSYDRLFVRHWDAWSDGRRSQLYVDGFGADGALSGAPAWVSKGLDGDVPSKPYGDAGEYAFSPDGKTVYFGLRVAGKSEPWSTNFDVYAAPADGAAAPRDLTAGNPAWDAYPAPAPDGKTLYYLAMKTPGFEADRFAIMALDLASGATREVDPHWDRSAGPLKVSADGRTLYTTADDWGQHPLFAVDVASGKATRLVDGGTVTGFDLAGKRLVLGRQDFKHPTDLYVAEPSGKRLAQLTHFNAERLKDIRFGDYEFFTFKGWNGDTVQGYVVKPAGYEKGKKYPVAFLIHGGPQGAWSNDFHYRWNPQTYAGAGFAVVTVNFHGSTGYGQAFTDAISQHWGDRPLEDLQKGWQAALDKYAFLDGDRACALGASYGGYMVYWMAGVWNRPWKCLVDHDGVFDTRMMYYATEELWFEEHENGGTQFEHPENYEAFNPLNHVKDWRVPMLVVHGGRDYRIPETQGLGAFTALQRRGIESRLLYFPDENHWVTKPQNSVLWHRTVEDWLKRWTAAP
ncbi:dipeptidyl aminopeptidase/acylaminoacylpeptidase [Mizugakiibacter sediminis]|uniref:Dipeptidyl aminopeptidase/acylaminoacylpeptidase n=1 Tax=Mizugakiibacter sediminis TaxID=1475481 RepID=A0A0K8QKJ8_9GAMM|nr:S9 family peptidase [Mizugakiibacter sediminis]GAP65012.1 dipeptidyl aminopeptidase/acylaminoacylpeptidase [Mizugakiibacter sediminis]